MQLLSRRRSGPLRFAKFRAYACWEKLEGGQQRLENQHHWLHLLAAYSALISEMKVGISASDVTGQGNPASCSSASSNPIYYGRLGGGSSR